jgi:YD repeat-containing protein
MKTKDFTTKMTSARLAENLEKQFSSRVNLTKYNREQLEDIRNKLRTRIFQQEGVSKFNELLTNETYQKDKAMLELLNTRIKEMLGEQMQKLRDKMAQLSEGKKGDGNLANNAKPYDKVTRGDVIAGRLGKDEKGGKKNKDVEEAAEKTSKPWTDKSGKQHPGTAVKGDKYTGKDADKDVKEETKAGEKTTSSTGGTTQVQYDKDGKRTGVKHTAGKNYGAMKQPFDRNSKDLEEGKPHPKDCDCKECMMQEGSKPDFLDLNKNGNKTKPMKKAAADKKAGPKKGVNPFAKKGTEPKKGVNPFAKKKVKESQYKHNVRFVNESLQFLLNEDEEGKAQAITAAGDIVNDFTGWMQRVGQYQTKAIIELSDQIRAEFGQAESEAFKQAVGPALSAALETLTQQREAISNAVATLASGAAPEEPMGMEPDMGDPMEPGMDAAGPDEMNPPMGDEFGASDAAVGGDIASGREMRESKFARKLAESHSIMAKLAK